MAHKIIFFICISCVTLVGCERISTQNLSNDSPLWHGYSPGEVLILQSDVFFLELDDKQRGKRFVLSPEGIFEHPNRFFTVPISIKQYQDESALFQGELVKGRSYNIPTKVVNVIGAGTRIKIISATKYNQWTWFFGTASWVVVYGEILDGEKLGTKVEMTDLSVRKKLGVLSADVVVYEPNLSLLTPVTINE